ncbi:aminopeptidase N isoform X2 [Ceratina calcarata]|nr:aminopeptidase N isoform X2 [Ceratina calcarata]
MRWIAAVAGFFLILVSSQDVEAEPSRNGLAETPWRAKRSIDVNDVYEKEEKMRRHRLPEEMSLSSYHLELEPFLADPYEFKGRVRINVTWLDSSDRLTLRALPNLKITNYSVRHVKPSDEEREKGLPLMDVNVARVDLPKETRPWYTLHFEQILTNGSTFEIDISFSGQFSTDRTIGFFKSEYNDADGNKYPFVGTNFRLGYAHGVFPSMDEPSYKTTFRLSVLRPKNMTALSNTPLETSKEVAGQPDMVWDHFAKTPKISTYQLALTVSNLESIAPTQEINEMDGRKLEIKVWGRKEFLKHLKDAPDKVVKIMNYFQDYFNSSIGLPKLDLMAVPMYNAAKPSDSWGLILFKESELGSPSVWNTAYELVYQWIGQYITPSHWTSGTSVNKAINSFLASMATVDINPDEMEGKWPMTLLYSLYYEFGKFEPFSRVNGIRNEAMLAKEELVFRMFNYTLGEDLFQKGVRHFFRSCSQTDTRKFFADEIYTRLNDVANETSILSANYPTINSIAARWTNRDRVPVVTVNRDYKARTITFNQKVYLREAPRAFTPRVSYEWDIPLVMMSQENLEYRPPCRLWLIKDKPEKNLTVPDNVTDDQFVIVNPEEIGMFPVNYDICNWKMLSQFLQGPQRETIPVLTRAKLLHDSWNLAYSGELCFRIALSMTLFLKEERSHVVWEPVFMMIDHIGRRIEGFDVYPKFEAYTRTLLKPLYEELNKSVDPDEPSWKTHMRSMAKSFLCRAGYEPCVKEARDQYKKWLIDEDPDKGNPVANEFICPVFKWGTEEEWEFGLQRVINFPQSSPERKQNERTYLLKSLAGCSQDAYKIERLLNATFFDKDKKTFSDSDIQLILVTLSGRSSGYTTVFNFFVNNWDAVKQRFEDKPYLWRRVMESASSSFSTQKGLDLVQKLYANHEDEFKSTRSDLRIPKNFQAERKEWNEKNLPVIDAWLTENLPKEELEAIQDRITTTVTPAIDLLSDLS